MTKQSMKAIMMMVGLITMAAMIACAPSNQEATMPTTQPIQTMITLPSNHSVDVTIDRLEAAAKAKGLNVFARINHYENAKKMGLTMQPSTLLLFGSPKLGVPLMTDAPSIGIDLPV